MTAPRRLLLASIHDVGPKFEREIETLAELYERQLGGPRFAMLVVPDHWGEAPLAQAPAFRARLREWASRGVEMFVHGWCHRDLADHTGIAALKARHMTASEGEFLGLSQSEAAQRMRDGRALIEDTIGAPVAGFIAPAWLYGPGALAALDESGFALAEDHWKVWQPGSNTVLTRGPVITWASRSAARRLSSLAVAQAARIALRQRVVRVAVHPGDTRFPVLMTSIRQTIGALRDNRIPGLYQDLLTAAGSAGAEGRAKQRDDCQ